MAPSGTSIASRRTVLNDGYQKLEVLFVILAKDPDSFCPRCGAAGVLYADAPLNALSRYRRGAIICSDCGRDEALQGDQAVWAVDFEADDD